MNAKRSGTNSPSFDPRAALANASKSAVIQAKNLNPTPQKDSTASSPPSSTSPTSNLRPTSPSVVSNTSSPLRQSNSNVSNLENGVVCDRCEENKATLKCIDCGQKPYCDPCSKEIHVVKWATHKVESVASTPSSLPVNRPLQTRPLGTSSSISRPLPPTRSGATSISSSNLNSPKPTQPLKPINANTDLDFSSDAQITELKEQFLDEVIDTLMTASLGLLMEGILLQDAKTHGLVYCRLSEDQMILELCPIDNPATFKKGSGVTLNGSEKVNISDIVDILRETGGTAEGSNSNLMIIQLKSGASRVLSPLENYDNFVFVFDGLRCLIGMEMQSSEMQSRLRALTEVKALIQLYPNSFSPQLPSKPTNYNFVVNISE